MYNNINIKQVLKDILQFKYYNTKQHKVAMCNCFVISCISQYILKFTQLTT